MRAKSGISGWGGGVIVMPWGGEIWRDMAYGAYSAYGTYVAYGAYGPYWAYVAYGAYGAYVAYGVWEIWRDMERLGNTWNIGK